jgi:hypothetical protein
MCKKSKGHRAVNVSQGDGRTLIARVCTKCYRLMEQRVVEEAMRRARGPEVTSVFVDESVEPCSMADVPGQVAEPSDE